MRACHDHLHQVQTSRVVLHVQNGAGNIRRQFGPIVHRFPVGHRPVNGYPFGQGKLDPKGGTLTDLRINADMTVHPLDKMLCDGKADAGAFNVRGLHPQPVERPKEFPVHVLGNALAGVGDGDMKHAAGCFMTIERDLAVLAVVLDSVGQQVEQRLLEPDLVGTYLRRCLEAFSDDDLDTAFVCHRMDKRKTFIEGGFGAYILNGQLHIAAFDLGKVQYFLDQLK